MSDASTGPLQFGLLGSLRVLDEHGTSLDLGGPQARVVLAMLVAADGRTVTVDALIDEVWGDHTPGSAAGTLQSYVSRLRRVLEPKRAAGASGLLRWEPPG